MPTYEYRCPKCGTEFEQFQKITAKPAARCPKCGARAERQLSAGAGLVFKGSGFYLTDYGRAGQKPKSSGGEAASVSGSGGPGGEKAGGEKAGGEKAGGEKAGGEKAGGEKAGGGASSGSKSSDGSASSTSKSKKEDG